MIITSVRKTSSERYTITVDGEEVRSTLGVVTELRLFDGKNIDREQLEEIKLLSVRYLTREKALEILSRRLMSSGELKKKLMEKGADADTADYCVGWLTDNRLLDDAHYAEAVVRHYSAKGYGIAKIRNEFIKRCISREYWDDALESLPEDTEVIDRLVAQKLNDPEDRSQIDKLTSMLYRRGYSWDEIKSALARFDVDNY